MFLQGIILLMLVYRLLWERSERFCILQILGYFPEFVAATIEDCLIEEQLKTTSTQHT